MKVKWVVAWLAVLAVAVLCCAAAWAEEAGKEKPWQGKLADGTVIGEKELTEIVRLHKIWLDSEQGKGNKADFGGAHLRSAKLRGAKLDHVDLGGADLLGADLEGASLVDANLVYADLRMANIREANLLGANLRRAKLRVADLRAANLSAANLHKANFDSSKLSGANLIGARISEAEFAWSDLKRVRFEPNSRDIKDEEGRLTTQPWWPSLSSFVEAYNLWQLVYEDNPQPLTALRDKLKQDGFLPAAHQLTHALRHNKDGVGWDSHVAYYLVAWPTEWGLSPLRPLVLLLVPAACAFVFYFISLSIKGGKDGIWREWLPDRMRQDQGGKKPERLMPRHLWPRLGFAFYFSLLSAFHIGLKSMALGTWLNRIHPREYTLRATGWVRVISGVQSLISVYLLALAVLTYFGRPFE